MTLSKAAERIGARLTLGALGTGLLCPLRLRLVELHGAGVTDGLLLPDVAKLLDAEALVVRVVAGEVAVGLEALLGVAAVEKELFVVAHGQERDGSLRGSIFALWVGHVSLGTEFQGLEVRPRNVQFPRSRTLR